MKHYRAVGVIVKVSHLWLYKQTISCKWDKLYCAKEKTTTFLNVIVKDEGACSAPSGLLFSSSRARCLLGVHHLMSLIIDRLQLHYFGPNSRSAPPATRQHGRVLTLELPHSIPLLKPHTHLLNLNSEAPSRLRI